MMLAILWGAWALINLVVFVLYGIDKRRAKKGAWRIPERTLLMGVWLMGGVGAFAAMRVFRHKTKHVRFYVGVPCGAVLSLAVMAVLTAAIMGVF